MLCAGDGRVDAVIAVPGTTRNILLVQDASTGGFKDETSARGAASTMRTYTVLLVDLYGNGWLDVVFGGASVQVFRNAAGQFEDVSLAEDLGGTEVYSVASGGFVGDLDLDVMVTLYNGAQFGSVLHSRAQPAAPSSTQLASPGTFLGAVATDANLDGTVDFAFFRDNGAPSVWMSVVHGQLAEQDPALGFTTSSNYITAVPFDVVRAQAAVAVLTFSFSSANGRVCVRMLAGRRW